MRRSPTDLPDATNLAAVRTEVDIINFLVVGRKVVDVVEVWEGEDPEMSIVSTGSQEFAIETDADNLAIWLRLVVIYLNLF